MAPPLQEKGKVITTGSTEIDKKLGGGIPVGSLVLLEGQSDAGKSVLTQHFTHSTLRDKISVAFYTTENTVKSLLSQMNSLNLDVTDYFLCDRLRIYPIEMTGGNDDTSVAFEDLKRHFDNLPPRFELIIFDSLTGMVAHAEDRGLIDFFAGCKKLCDLGRTIVPIVHSYAFADQMLIRVRSLCDAHLVMKIDQMGDRLVKSMEVAKVRNADQSTGNIISFDVEPGIGMKIIPISKAKA